MKMCYVKKSLTDLYCISIYIFRISNFIETESRLVFARGWAGAVGGRGGLKNGE